MKWIAAEGDDKFHEFYKIRHFFYYKYYVSVVATALMSVACGSVADAARWMPTDRYTEFKLEIKDRYYGNH